MLRFGINSCERFTLMVCSLPSDSVPGNLRYEWLKRMFPVAHVVHLNDPSMPQAPEEHDRFWEIWRTTVRSMVPDAIDAVFASETYGWRLADELGATFVPFDVARGAFPTSGTRVRGNPLREWAYLSPVVRAYYTKRVAVLGPEATGKSTLVEALAERFHTRAVIEYARPLFNAFVAEGRRAPGEFRYEDLELVARGQRALEDTLAEASNGVLICDTDVLTTKTWSEYLYGKVDPWIDGEASRRSYDLTFLLHPADNPYVQDGQRVMTDLHVRERFFDQLCANLDQVGRQYHVLRGTYDERFREAVERIGELLGGTTLEAHE